MADAPQKKKKNNKKRRGSKADVRNSSSNDATKSTSFDAVSLAL